MSKWENHNVEIDDDDLPIGKYRIYDDEGAVVATATDAVIPQPRSVLSCLRFLFDITTGSAKIGRRQPKSGPPQIADIENAIPTRGVKRAREGDDKGEARTNTAGEVNTAEEAPTGAANTAEEAPTGEANTAKEEEETQFNP